MVKEKEVEGLPVDYFKQKEGGGGSGGLKTLGCVTRLQKGETEQKRESTK